MALDPGGGLGGEEREEREEREAWRAVKPLIDGVPTDEVPDATPPDIHAQVALVEEFRSLLAPFPHGWLNFAEVLALIDDDLITLLQMHRDATERIPSPADRVE